jgi:hypothetical protein
MSTDDACDTSCDRRCHVMRVAIAIRTTLTLDLASSFLVYPFHIVYSPSSCYNTRGSDWERGLRECRAGLILKV